jgi:N-methylhydantoinase A
MKRIGIDVGGTFTDLIMTDEASGEVWTTKVFTTPSNPADGTLSGLRRLLEIAASKPKEVAFIGHGTTIATNMVIEGKGAKTALLATKGFRDLLEFRRVSRHDRADLYDMFYDNPPALVPRHLRREIPERMLFDGTVKEPLDIDAVRREVEKLKQGGVEAIAICFLNSYCNPAHEKAASDACRSVFPDAFVTASYEVNPEMLEYERTSTTVINAMLGPRCASYSRALDKRVQELGVPKDALHLMQSNGGLSKPATISNLPVTLLESGPAGGVTGMAWFCAKLGVPNAIMSDMGGTSYDVSLIRNGRPEFRHSTLLHRQVVQCPTIDIVSIGAGGGSIAWIDEGGGVQIGPMSAGADPGPACYGRGGTRPAMTDCNVVLGFIDPDSFLGGEVKLDREAAERVITDHIAKPLGISCVEGARLVREVANAKMAQTIRLVTIERGFDPRDFVSVPYGGAGPVHAVDVARMLDIPKIVVPPMPGVFSAFGMLVADIAHDYQASLHQVVEEITPKTVSEIYDRLSSTATSKLLESGVPRERIELQRQADVRYLPQAETITVDVPSGPLSIESIRAIGREFEAAHSRLWNFTLSNHPILITNLRVRAVGKTNALVNPRVPTGSAAPKPVSERKIILEGREEHLPCYLRAELPQGARIAGPAIIQEQSTSLAFYKGHTAEIGELGSIILTMDGSAHG